MKDRRKIPSVLDDSFKLRLVKSVLSRLESLAQDEEPTVDSWVTLYDDAKGNKTGQGIAAKIVLIRGDRYTAVDSNGFRYVVPRSDFAYTPKKR